MQHDHVLKKLNFELLTPRVGWEGGSDGKIFATIGYILKFNIQHGYVLKKLNFDI